MSRTLILSHSDIRKLEISVTEILESVKKGLVDHALGKTLLAPKLTFRPEPHSFYTSMPSGNSDDRILGLKLVQRPSVPLKKGPGVFGTMFMNDYETGQLMSIMDATWLTSIRTGAVAALSIEAYAKHPVEKISLMGAGNVGMATVLCLSESIPSLKEIKVLKYKDAVERLRKRFEHTDLIFTEVAEIKDLFTDVQVVVTSLTFAGEPFVKKEWLFDGMLALPLHMRGWQDCDPLFNKMFTDDYEHTKAWLYRLDGEIGEVLAGIKPGRENDKEKIIAYNYGIAIDDLAVAKLVYQHAVRNEVGMWTTLDDYEDKYLI